MEYGLIAAFLLVLLAAVYVAWRRAARTFTPPHSLGDGSLAERARALRAAGKEEEAVQLVHRETGMPRRRARAFVRRLR